MLSLIPIIGPGLAAILSLALSGLALPFFGPIVATSIGLALWFAFLF